MLPVPFASTAMMHKHHLDAMHSTLNFPSGSSCLQECEASLTPSIHAYVVKLHVCTVVKNISTILAGDQL